VIERLGLALVLALAAGLAIAQIDREVVYYDSGAYLVTGKSLATDEGYRNINLPGSPPQDLYPPVVPLVASWIWRASPGFPGNLVLLKSFSMALGMAYLLASYLWLRRAEAIPPSGAIAGVALLGCHRLFLLFSTVTSSELLYTLLSLVALLAVADGPDEPRRTRRFAVAVAAGGLAVLTRTIGIALFLALFCEAWARKRRRSAIAVGAAGLAVLVPWLAWNWHARAAYASFPAEVAVNYRGYLVNLASTDWLARSYQALPINAAGMILSAGSWIVPSLQDARGTSLLPGMFVFVTAALASLAALRRPARAHDWYFAFAILAILAWPWPLNDRFVFVLSPLIVGYLFSGGRWFADRWTGPGRRAVLSVFGVVVVAALVSDLDTARLLYRNKTARESMWASFHETAAWLRVHVPARTAIVTTNDPVYYLFTDRRTVRLAYPDPFSIYYRPVNAPGYADPVAVLAWFRRVHACYIVRDPLNGIQQSAFFDKLIESVGRASTPPLQRVYANGSFEVLEVPLCR
jgi:hypothetical protein